MTDVDIENLRKYATADDPFGDGCTIVPQELLQHAYEHLVELRSMIRKQNEQASPANHS